jgi:PAS domain S-box-containing protein
LSGSYQLHPAAWPWIAVAALLVVLAAVILVLQRANRVARLFCLMIALVAVWLGGFAMMFCSTEVGVAAMWGRIALAGVALLPAALYDFTATALRIRHARATMIRAIWLLTAIFAAMALFTNLVAAGVMWHPWGFYPAAGPLMPAFVGFFAVALTAHLVEYLRAWSAEHDPLRKRRLRNLMIAFSIVYIGAIDFAPMFGSSIRPFGYLPVLTFVVFASRSIRRHRLQPVSAARAAREILETMADALFVLDGAGKIRVVNDAVRALFGYRDLEIIGKPMTTLLRADDRQAELPLLHFETVRDRESILRHRDGTPIAVSLSISPLREAEAIDGAVLIARDIRERKHAEEELHEFARKLQQSNRELEDFAYVASHDLQEPLRKIQAFGDRLRARYGEALTAEGADYVERMQRAAGRMQKLINDLLAFSRITTKGQPFVPVDLGAVAHEVVHDLETRIHDSGGEVVVGAMPTIEADALQMRQMLQNLVGNALKFHRSEAPPRVEVEGAIDDGMARIRVADNGIGFEERHADRIFTMFERLHSRGSYEGTGIGLAICRKIAQRHGGDITASSRLGEGSVFTVTIPIHGARTSGPQSTDLGSGDHLGNQSLDQRSSDGGPEVRAPHEERT